MGIKRWTQEEIEYLESRWGELSVPGIAQRLGRSVEAVLIKANRLGLGGHLSGGTKITLSRLCKALGKAGYYHSATTRWISLGLPVSYRKTVRGRHIMIDIDDFWEWAEKNKDVVNLSLMPEGALGREPGWVKEARRARFSEQRKTSPWTKDEDAKLIHMLESGRYTYGELSERLMRSEGAIKRRISKLGTPCRARRKPAKKWTAEETEQLLKLRSAGHSWEEIGRRLGRSGMAVRGKYELILNPEYANPYRRKTESPGEKELPARRSIHAKTPEELLNELKEQEEEK